MIRDKGFTLYELMITVTLSGLILSSVYAAHKTQQTSYALQTRVSTMQQNLRGALCLMKKDIRMAGYDPLGSGNFGIIAVGLDSNGNGTLTFTLDDNLNRTPDKTDGNGLVDAKETLVYALYDYPTASPDGISDLGRKYGKRRQLISRNIEALGFAYAFDRPGDGDRSLDKDINGNIIWAIDSDNDQDLDVNLDSDNDGDIDIHDNPRGKPLSHKDNGMIGDIKLSHIRGIQIWLLAVCEKKHPQETHPKIAYRVSNQILMPTDGLHRRLMTVIVSCRNLGMWPNN